MSGPGFPPDQSSAFPRDRALSRTRPPLPCRPAAPVPSMGLRWQAEPEGPGAEWEPRRGRARHRWAGQAPDPVGGRGACLGSDCSMDGGTPGLSRTPRARAGQVPEPVGGPRAHFNVPNGAAGGGVRLLYVPLPHVDHPWTPMVSGLLRPSAWRLDRPRRRGLRGIVAVPGGTRGRAPGRTGRRGPFSLTFHPGYVRVGGTSPGSRLVPGTTGRRGYRRGHVPPIPLCVCLRTRVRARPAPRDPRNQGLPSIPGPRRGP